MRSTAQTLSPFSLILLWESESEYLSTMYREGNRFSLFSHYTTCIWVRKRVSEESEWRKWMSGESSIPWKKNGIQLTYLTIYCTFLHLFYLLHFSASFHPPFILPFFVIKYVMMSLLSGSYSYGTLVSYKRKNCLKNSTHSFVESQITQNGLSVSYESSFPGS